MTRQSVQRAVAIIQAFGAMPDRWPVKERDAVEDALRSPGLSEHLARERALDAWLESYEVPLPGAALLHRIAASGPRERTVSSWQRWWPTGAMAAAATAGMVLGSVALERITARQADIDAVSYSMSYDLQAGSILP